MNEITDPLEQAIGAVLFFSPVVPDDTPLPQVRHLVTTLAEMVRSVLGARIAATHVYEMLSTERPQNERWGPLYLPFEDYARVAAELGGSACMMAQPLSGVYHEAANRLIEIGDRLIEACRQQKDLTP